jgi:hypothetical protein
VGSALGTIVLDQLRRSFCVSIGEVSLTRDGVGHVWRLSAADAESGQTWAAEDEDYYRAACMLAELMGFELEDG